MFSAPIAAANLRRANVLVPNVEVLKEVEPTAAPAIAVSISETAPPFCMHSFLFFVSLRFIDATQSLRCDGAEEGVRGLQGPAV